MDSIVQPNREENCSEELDAALALLVDAITYYLPSIEVLCIIDHCIV
jgi:hypothetical protein